MTGKGEPRRWSLSHVYVVCWQASVADDDGLKEVDAFVAAYPTREDADLAAAAFSSARPDRTYTVGPWCLDGD